MAVLLQEAIREGTAQSEHLLYRRASVPQETKPGSRKHLVSDPREVRRGTRNGRLNKTWEWQIKTFR